MGKRQLKAFSVSVTGLLMAFSLLACQGPPGPIGPAGPAGPGADPKALPGSLAVSPNSIPEDAQTAVTYAGGGFAPGDTVVVNLLLDSGEILLSGGDVSKSGAFRLLHQWGRLGGEGARQPTVAPGTYTLIVRSGKGITATAAITITPKPTPTPAPRN